MQHSRYNETFLPGTLVICSFMFPEMTSAVLGTVRQDLRILTLPGRLPKQGPASSD